MRVLVLFSVWAPDDSRNSHLWLDWYRQIATNQFGDDTIMIAVSPSSSSVVNEYFSGQRNVLLYDVYPKDFLINSDAGGFQFLLSKARKYLHKFDFVMFLHTKGISHDFAMLEPMRHRLQEGLFNRAKLHNILSEHPRHIVCDRAHMTQARGSVEQCESFARRIGISYPVFNFGATFTLYCAPAPLVASLCGLLQDDFFKRNLEAQGLNRFAFEGLFPSLLAMIGAEPYTICGCGFDPKLNENVSYDLAPEHNSAIVAREYNNRRLLLDKYVQRPIPYVFTKQDRLYDIGIVFMH